MVEFKRETPHYMQKSIFEPEEIHSGNVHRIIFLASS